MAEETGKEEATATATTTPMTNLEKDTGINEQEALDELEKAQKAWNTDTEIERILKAFKLDAYAVMDLQPGVAESDIKRTYRLKSVLVHPDKAAHPRAAEAFDRLAQAYQALLDEKQRARLDEAIADARMLLIRARGWTVDHPALTSDEFRRDWRAKTADVLIDNEIRRRKQVKGQMQEEGRQQRKEDEEAAERKRKREHEEAWEKTREQRIGSWRDFQKGKEGEKKKKMKKKMKVLG